MAEFMSGGEEVLAEKWLFLVIQSIVLWETKINSEYKATIDSECNTMIDSKPTWAGLS